MNTSFVFLVFVSASITANVSAYYYIFIVITNKENQITFCGCCKLTVMFGNRVHELLLRLDLIIHYHLWLECFFVLLK